MKTVLITGTGGLIGSSSASNFLKKNFKVIGIDNDQRAYFFGKEASTKWMVAQLCKEKNYNHHTIDIRDFDSLKQLFKNHGASLTAVIHCAAQPSHDWAAKEPLTDFGINALGTLNLLQLTKEFAREASFIFTSTNKVYGDRPNFLPLVEKETRWEIASSHEYHQKGIPESFNIDQCLHSVFGASKVAADIMVQEYGRYFGLNSVCFRGGCLTGPAHSAASLHGFLGYLVKCAVTETPYKIIGYKGKQVRDNIHSDDVFGAFYEFIQNPSKGKVYNLGGGIENNCSILEAITLIENKVDRKIRYSFDETPRIGDHQWYVSDLTNFKKDYPQWKITKNLVCTINEICDSYLERFGKTKEQHD